MKKYSSPICKFNAFKAEDVITASKFTEFGVCSELINLDNGAQIDSIDINW